jgi:hypothetical protein
LHDRYVTPLVKPQATPAEVSCPRCRPSNIGLTGRKLPLSVADINKRILNVVDNKGAKSMGWDAPEKPIHKALKGYGDAYPCQVETPFLSGNLEEFMIAMRQQRAVKLLM